MSNDNDDKKFRLADYYTPSLEEGNYTIKFNQTIDSKQQTFSTTKDFRIAVNTKILQENAVFNVHPAPNERGDFSTELPYIVFNDPFYPWMKSFPNNIPSKQSDEKNKFPIPWLALIVVSEDEIVEEKDIKYSELPNEKDITVKDENGIYQKTYFKYEENDLSPCQNSDTIHLITVSKNTFKSIMPEKDDRPWLTHGKQVDLSNTEDVVAQKSGYFSVIIANRFPPPSKNQNESVKNTIHLIAAYLYDTPENGQANPEFDNLEFIKMISLYHWNIYSDFVEKGKDNHTEKSFYAITNNIKTGTVKETRALREHYLRNGEKTYSWYYSPIRPTHFDRVNSDKVILNGEKKYTADGRLIYNATCGIFDVTYSAAFNLGRLVTLSHDSEAKRIVSLRKKNKIDAYLNSLNKEIGINNSQLIEKLKDGIYNEKKNS